jgi:exodeoxyribonuclease VII small subunit
VAERKPSPRRVPARNLSFGEAVTEVEEILAGLEQDEVDIDRLGEQVARAVELIQVCREKLERTDREVRDLVAGLQAPAAGDRSESRDEDVEDERNGEA